MALVYQDGSPVVAARLSWRSARRRRWPARSINPTLGFATVNNVGGGRKYPVRSVLRRASARAFSVAWNPKFSDGVLGKLFGENKTVLRAGYGRIFGRLNGVNLLLVPLLPPGLLQAVSCTGVSRTGQCLGNNGVDPSTAFRIGTDGKSAPLPSVSPTLAAALSFRAWAATPAPRDVTSLDPKYRPERTDNVTVSMQRQINQDDEHGSRLHRPHHPQRNAADQSGCGSVHDHARRPDVRQRIRRRPTSPRRTPGGTFRAGAAVL